MKTLFAGVSLALLAAAVPSRVAAQDLGISNSRIIVGNGSVIESGTVVVRNGRIASVGAATAAPAGARQIDARGMTLMPGFIDGHRHIISGNVEQWFANAPQRMQEFLEAGYTTLLAGGGPAEGNLELKRRIDSGQLKGPRVK